MLSIWYFAQTSHFVIPLDRSRFVIYSVSEVFNMRIKEIRLDRNLSQRELATALKIAPNTLSQYENEKREPDLKTLEHIADVLRVSVDCLLGRDDERPAPGTEDGPGESAKRFMELVDKLTPDQQQLLLAQLQAWTEQNRLRSPAAPQSDEETAPESDL